MDELPWILTPCPLCGLGGIPGTLSDSGVCVHCRADPPDWSFCRALFRYETPVRQMIQQLKYNSMLKHAFVFGRVLTMASRLHWQQQVPQCLLPVPLHPRRLRERGFNQAVEIARVCARQMHLPLVTDAIVRIKNTPTQTGLSARQRDINIRGAFELVQPLPYRHVAIVDDVMTTGSTVSELVRTLRQAGVEIIEVWCVARADRPGDRGSVTVRSRNSAPRG